jgi:hypothetical protein
MIYDIKWHFIDICNFVLSHSKIEFTFFYSNIGKFAEMTFWIFSQSCTFFNSLCCKGWTTWAIYTIKFTNVLEFIGNLFYLAFLSIDKNSSYPTLAFFCVCVYGKYAIYLHFLQSGCAHMDMPGVCCILHLIFTEILSTCAKLFYQYIINFQLHCSWALITVLRMHFDCIAMILWFFYFKYLQNQFFILQKKGRNRNDKINHGISERVSTLGRDAAAILI